MKKSDVIHALLAEKWQNTPCSSASAFAPTNIALCKYWGKRNSELNLPVTSSLSISLADKGAFTELKVIDHAEDTVWLNGQQVATSSHFYQRLTEFLNLFRTKQNWHFELNIKSTIPIAAGLASSACGFAALIIGLNKLFDWQLEPYQLSILARLGSGSASRSIWTGFVEWQAGVREDGMDSFAKTIPQQWPELCVGLHIISDAEKNISSREAMSRSVNTSLFYSAWPEKVNQDLPRLKAAIQTKDFELLAQTAESNALHMHALMLSSWPPVSYCLEQTIAAMQKIWALRREGLAIYFTQDAGPNLKLLFLKENIKLIQSYFPILDIVQPFNI